MSHSTDEARAGEAARAFTRTFGREPAAIVLAPGRVNLIGEHTDYNEGFVLPAAVERAVVVAAGPAREPRSWVVSEQLGGPVEIDARSRKKDWPRLLREILDEIGGDRVDLWVGGDLPAGAGLGSSAAVAVAASLAVADATGRPDPAADPPALARAVLRAEHRAGTRCGLMDPLASLLGRPGAALLIDCRSLEVRPRPLPAGVRILVLDTRVRRRLAISAYNRRRAECEWALDFLRAKTGRDLRTLRDLGPSDRAAVEALPEPLRQRARHVVSENARVLETAAALERSDLSVVGRRLAASHASLRDDYEVTIPELDLLVEAAASVEGCLGARMTGAGFGGCVVALVAAERVDAVAGAARDAYRERFGREPGSFDSAAGAGARRLHAA